MPNKKEENRGSHRRRL